MTALTRQQFIILCLLTLAWGLNWPVMKLGVMNFPPLSFRALSMWLGLPVLAIALLVLRVPFRMPRQHWPELALLTLCNMVVWHIFVILGVTSISSGRAAILGYTMPIFSALWGLFVFGDHLRARGWMGVGAAALGVVLLLWHELVGMGSKPWGAMGAIGILFAACIWALGTRLLRNTKITAPTLSIVWWMTFITAVVMSLLALIVESTRWAAPNPATWFAISYNAVLIFGFAHAAWFYLARSLPPLASSLSVMLIPVLGVFSGSYLLKETLHWQDYTAVALMVIAIATVLMPASPTARPTREMK
jgi:drug/metabolite transporter (DMT)-like permease